MRDVANASRTGYFIQKLVPHTANSVDREYDPNGWLFPSRKANVKEGHLTVDAVRRIIKDFCKELNIVGN